eukprot:Hpha_TRINITY_DN26992_c0_g1::TRINITY_DN26992_c0_g1_i1::g.24935::m.24935
MTSWKAHWEVSSSTPPRSVRDAASTVDLWTCGELGLLLTSCCLGGCLSELVRVMCSRWRRALRRSHSTSPTLRCVSVWTAAHFCSVRYTRATAEQLRADLWLPKELSTVRVDSYSIDLFSPSEVFSPFTPGSARDILWWPETERSSQREDEPYVPVIREDGMQSPHPDGPIQ